MDSNRLILNDYDLSTSTIETSTETVGFTSVIAPKGPCRPVRISANSSAKMQDIFGVSSEEYPELLEAEVFNSEYDLYVSAPYKSATVPVAYVTGQGIFTSANTVEYDSVLEECLETGVFEDENGEEVKIPGLNCGRMVEVEGSSTPVEEKIPGLYNILYGKTFGISSLSSDGASAYSAQGSLFDMKNGALVIPMGLSVKDYTVTFQPEALRLSNLPVAIDDKEYFDVLCTSLGNEIADANYGVIGKFVTYDDKSNGAFLIYDSSNTTTHAGKVIIFSDSATSLASEAFTDLAETEQQKFKKNGSGTDATYPEISFAETDELTILLIGKASGDNELTKTYISTKLAEVASRKALTCFWKKGDISMDDVYAVIMPKYPSTRSLHISFESFNANRNYKADDVASRNILKMSVYEEGAFHDASHPVTITGSLDSLATSANGAPLAFNSANSAYTSQNLVQIVVLKKFTAKSQLTNTTLKGYPSIVLSGGTRENYDDVIEAHNKSWEIAKSSDYSDVAVFFESTRHSRSEVTVSENRVIYDVKNKFFTLSNKHPLAGYIFNFTVAPSTVSEEASASAKLTTPLGFGANYWNICNEGIINLTTGGRIISPLTGARALMQCRIIDNKLGGVAPMFMNSGNPSMGGQLSGIIPVSKLVYKYDADMQSALDEVNMNPVINDRSLGIMVTGQKTCKDGEITDWSYIGHVSAFLLLKRELRRDVMIPQLGKANNPYYRELRYNQAMAIVNKRLTGDGRIWAEGTVDTSTADGCNDALALKARKFIINVKVKVDIFSEAVELNLTNVDQETELA